ncbi:hypothetical protein [Sphingomonas sp.]|uniref:hypothetical protein n=1 Tax=Sphingomonas sp. TaxID=28214 RepID=UPI002DD688AD|nr:hypothetical protein [Sphingomonas sp.]
MRIAFAAAVLSVVALPAAAQSRAGVEAADRLNDPVVQEGIAAAVGALAGIVLDTRVGPLARYTGRRDDIRPGDTLRDVKRRDDPHFERRLRDDTRRAVATAGMVAGDAVAMSGELARTADRLRGAVAPLAGVLTSRAPAYDDYDDYDGY